MEKHVLTYYKNTEKEILFNKISSFMEANNLNPIYIEVNSKWIKDNMQIFGKSMLSNLIESYIRDSKYRSITFEKYDCTKEISGNIKDKLHNIIKIYKFLKTRPARYNVPLSAWLDNPNNEWRLHPGATRISVLEYINVKVIPIILFDGIENLNNLPDSLNFREIDFDKFKSIYYRLRGSTLQLKEYSKRFEISEDHRLVKGFTDDMSYKVVVYENKISVNQLICFEKDNDGFWIPNLENIRL